MRLTPDLSKLHNRRYRQAVSVADSKPVAAGFNYFPHFQTPQLPPTFNPPERLAKLVNVAVSANSACFGLPYTGAYIQITSSRHSYIDYSHEL